MKSYLVIFFLVFITMHVKSQDNEETTQTFENETVINYSMIEKFKNYEYSDNQLSIMDILNNYNFEDAKLIITGYRNNVLDLSSSEKISSYLSEANKQINKSQLLIKNPEENKITATDFADNTF